MAVGFCTVPVVGVIWRVHLTGSLGFFRSTGISGMFLVHCKQGEIKSKKRKKGRVRGGGYIKVCKGFINLPI